MIHLRDMAKVKSVDAKLNALTRLVEKGFAAVARDISHRPTNSNVAGIIENFVPGILENYVPGIVRTVLEETVPAMIEEATRDIRTELASIRRDLEQLTAKVDNLVGLPKEIDHALERIRRIEKHIGIEHEITA